MLRYISGAIILLCLDTARGFHGTLFSIIGFPLAAVAACKENALTIALLRAIVLGFLFFPAYIDDVMNTIFTHATFSDILP